MPTFFVPARSSRHRKACVALFRALVREGRQVPLPTHLRAVAAHETFVHPVQRFVRRAFRQNKDDTSPRLIHAALEAGHKMVRMLHGARTEGSAEHASVISFLETHKAPVHVSYRQYKAQKKREDAAREAARIAAGGSPWLPLLTRRPIPGTETTTTDPWGNTYTTYEYEYVPSRPAKPLSELPGRRRVPRLVTEAMGIPFLRMHRRQPEVLSKVLQNRRARRARRTVQVGELTRTGLEAASAEDAWEAFVARAARDAGETVPRDVGLVPGVRGTQATFRHGVSVGIAYLSATIALDVADALARSRAYLAIVDRERALAEAEDAARVAQEAEDRVVDHVMRSRSKAVQRAKADTSMQRDKTEARS